MRKTRLIAVVLLCAAAVSSAFGQDRKVKSQVPPTYPEMARSMHLTGTVRVQVSITPDGSVKDAKIVGGHPMLADAALKAISRWKFEPGPAETQVIAVDFKQ